MYDSPTVPSWPASTTREVCRPVAKELSTAFFARKIAGEPYCSKAVCTICSRSAFVLKVGSANNIGCSLGSITNRCLHITMHVGGQESPKYTVMTQRLHVCRLSLALHIYPDALPYFRVKHKVTAHFPCWSFLVPYCMPCMMRTARNPVANKRALT